MDRLKNMNADAKMVIEVLINQGFALPDAIKEWENMKWNVAHNNANPMELLEEIGLEPDYIFALL